MESQEWESLKRIEEKLDRHIEAVNDVFQDNQKEHGKIFGVVSENRTNFKNLKDSVDSRFSTWKWIIGGIALGFFSFLSFFGVHLRGHE